MAATDDGSTLLKWRAAGKGQSPNSSSSSSPEDNSAAVVPETSEANAAAYNTFVFPHALDSDCLEGDGKDSDDDEDTDAVEELPLTSRLMQGKIFADPEENEKWKNRGWRAVQCCGGALLVLALIFDEMD
eukprot:CAMPEP_0169240240 /NCGR_PEP_ID=MMETSP1016-20121227/31350_1 /TAXON_ID=342587 /ORGANISM="Karlodinium micrum, Strain CCMP2283" /LENGTH=129 /DNA_ID=CAMNT_0009320249 /DNA_START=63 /DNA_END=451 /DNA_ORIENTATION=+